MKKYWFASLMALLLNTQCLTAFAQDATSDKAETKQLSEEEIENIHKTLIDYPYTQNGQVLMMKTSPELEQAMFVRVNAERSKRGLPMLRLSKKLSELARQNSAHMFANHYFGHCLADGRSFHDKINAMLNQFPRRNTNTSILENIHFQSGTTSAYAANAAFVASQSHFQAMTYNTVREIGVGVIYYEKTYFPLPVYDDDSSGRCTKIDEVTGENIDPNTPYLSTIWTQIYLTADDYFIGDEYADPNNTSTFENITMQPTPIQ